MSGTEVKTLGGTQITPTADKKEPTEVEKFKTMLVSQRQALAKVLPGHVSYDKFQSVVLTAVLTNPDLLLANRHSLVMSCIKSATDGLLPDGREAALVIFNNRKKNDGGQWMTVKTVQYMPMYGGILKKVRQSGEVLAIRAQVVYDKDDFEYVLGDEERVEHKPYLGSEPRGGVKAAYAIAKLKSGEIVREVMTLQDIEKVRKSSKAGAVQEHDDKLLKKGDKVGDPKGIWKDWYEEMTRKTVFRRLSKWLPQSVDLMDRIFENDDTMDVLKIEADEDTIEHEDGDAIEGDAQPSLTDQTGQPDLSAEIDKANKVAEKEPVPVEKEEEKRAPKKQTKSAPKEEKPSQTDENPRTVEKPFPGDPAPAQEEDDSGIIASANDTPQHLRFARMLATIFKQQKDVASLVSVIEVDYVSELNKLYQGNRELHEQVMDLYEQRLTELEGK